jgi:hypothetical protein
LRNIIPQGRGGGRRRTQGNAPNAHWFDGKKSNSIHGLVSAPVTVRSHFAAITTARARSGLLIGESGAFVR